MMLGGHAVKSWSVTQKVIATSSREAKYYVMVKGEERTCIGRGEAIVLCDASVALWLRSVLADVGIEKKVRLNTDPLAAKGI